MCGSPMTTDLTAMLQIEVGHTQLSIKTSPTQGQIQKSQKEEGGYYRGTIYFTEYSFKIMQNFTLKGGGGGEGLVPLDL